MSFHSHLNPSYFVSRLLLTFHLISACGFILTLLLSFALICLIPFFLFCPLVLLICFISFYCLILSCLNSWFFPPHLSTLIRFSSCINLCQLFLLSQCFSSHLYFLSYLDILFHFSFGLSLCHLCLVPFPLLLYLISTHFTRSSSYEFILALLFCLISSWCYSLCLLLSFSYLLLYS